MCLAGNPAMSSVLCIGDNRTLLEHRADILEPWASAGRRLKWLGCHESANSTGLVWSCWNRKGEEWTPKPWHTNLTANSQPSHSCGSRLLHNTQTYLEVGDEFAISDLPRDLGESSSELPRQKQTETGTPARVPNQKDPHALNIYGGAPFGTAGA